MPARVATSREVLSLSPDYEDKREPRFLLHQPAEEGKESPRRGDVRQPLFGGYIEDVEFVEKNALPATYGFRGVEAGPLGLLVPIFEVTCHF